MEALSVKFGILTGLFGVVGLIGLAALLGSVIWLIIRVANFDSMLPALLCVLASLALTVGGLALAPTPEVVYTEPARAPWEAPLEALKDRLGSLKDNGPWARLFKDKEAPEDAQDAAPEDGSPAEGDTPQDGAALTSANAGAAAPELGAARRDMPEAAGGGGEEDVGAMPPPTLQAAA